MNSLLLDSLSFKNQKRPPVWLMRQAGRYMASYQALRKQYPFLTLCHTPELIVKTTCLPIDELQPDAAILFSDILILPEAMGFHVRFDEGLGPIIENPLSTPQDIFQKPLSRLEELLNFLPPAIKQLKKILKVPLIGFAGAPFTLASYLIEGKTSRNLNKTKKWAYQDAEGFRQMITVLEAAIVKSLTIQMKSGCDCVQIFDSWSQGLTEDHFEKWCLEPLKRIVSHLKPLNKPIIYFCRGSSFRAEAIAKTGVSAISLDWLSPIRDIRNQLPEIPLQGNLDPEALYMPKEALIKEVKAILKAMDKDPGYIFNLGHGILPDVPYENVRTVIETVQSY